MSALPQLQALESLVSRAALLTDDGDRAVTFIPGNTGGFSAGTTTALQVILGVPTESDFLCTTVNAFPQYRIVDTTSVVATDLAFRPCEWVSTNDMALLVGAASQLYELDALIKTKDSFNGEHQNAPMSMASMFSSAQGLTGNSADAAALTAYQGGMKWPVPLYLPRGSAFTAEITPRFTSSARVSTLLSATVVMEFRVVVVLQGYKRVRAFR